MKAELKNRKKMLGGKRKELKQTSRENELLSQVLADYNNHNHDIIAQKHKQIEYLKSLHEYIGNVSHHNIDSRPSLVKELKTDQREIIKEINHLKRELVELSD
jgi:hypothetical protein